jgi:hypothetical protein
MDKAGQNSLGTKLRLTSNRNLMTNIAFHTPRRDARHCLKTLYAFCEFINYGQGKPWLNKRLWDVS